MYTPWQIYRYRQYLEESGQASMKHCKTADHSDREGASHFGGYTIGGKIEGKIRAANKDDEP
jgi:hypothetical protein